MSLCSEHRVAAVNGLRLVLDGAQTMEQYKAACPYLADAPVHDADGAREARGKPKITWFDYVDRFWLDARWKSTAYTPFRALIHKMLNDTTNDTENVWNNVKNDFMGGKKAASFSDVLAVVMGKVGDDASRIKSLSSSKLHDVRNILERRESESKRLKRDAMHAALRAMVHAFKTAPKVPIVDLGNGDFKIGEAAGGFVFVQRAEPVPLLKSLSSHELCAVPGVKLVTALGERVAGADVKGKDWGSGRSSTAIFSAVSRARQVFAGEANFGVNDDVVASLMRQLNNARDAGLLREFDALQRVPSSVVKSLIRKLHPEMAAALNALLTRDSAVCVSNAEVADAVRRAWPPLKIRDFKIGAHTTVPHIAYIYAVCLCLSASAWLAEYERVIVRGETTSLAHGNAALHDVPLCARGNARARACRRDCGQGRRAPVGLLRRPGAARR
jgi:hypothetical protein